MAQRYGQTPDHLLELERSGFSGPARYAFNRAVCTLARRIEQQAQEQIEEIVATPTPMPKGQMRSHKPKWSMRDLLYDRAEGGDPDDEDAEVLPEFATLPTALL